MNIKALSPKLGICETHDTAYVDAEQMDASSFRSGRIDDVVATIVSLLYCSCSIE